MSVAKRSSMSGLFGVEERMGVRLLAGRGIRGGMDLSCEGIREFWKPGKGRGRLELGVGQQCGHREVNGGKRERTRVEAENPKVK
jgi:hypothetical protein